MPRPYKGDRCKVCDRHVSECGTLSTRGKCRWCGVGAAIENMIGLNEHTGPPLRRWRRGLILAGGGILPDDLQDED